MSPGSSPGIMYSDIQRCDIYYYSAYKLETIFSTNSMHIETNDARTAQGKEYSCSHVDGMNSHVMYVTKVMIKQGSTPSSSRGGIKWSRHKIQSCVFHHRKPWHLFVFMNRAFISLNKANCCDVRL